jgi:RND family efflux transporter MFP subunit
MPAKANTRQGQGQGQAQAQAQGQVDQRSFDCVMAASARVKLGPQIAGVLRRVHVERGERVTAGQPVASLASEVEEAQADLARIRAENDTAIRSNHAKLELARNRLGRLTRLRATNAVTERDFEEAQAEFRVAEMELRDAEFNQKVAEAELRRANEQVNQRRIVSPIDAVVVDRHLSPGEYVSEQSQIVSLARIDLLHVEVYVPVAYFGQIVPGARALVSPEAPVDGRREAEVAIVDEVIDTSSGTFGVRLHMPNKLAPLPAGLRCKVRFAPAPTR